MTLKESLTIKRLELFKSLPNNTIAFIAASISYPKNADEMHTYSPNTDMLCFTGITQFETIFAILKNGKQCTEYLFIKPIDEQKVLWDGSMLSKEEATEISGISNIHTLDDFDSFLYGTVPNFENIFLNSNEHLRNSLCISTGDSLLSKKIKEMFPLHNYGRLSSIIHSIRSKKTTYELQALREACLVSSLSFREILKQIKSNKYEYEIKAELIYNFLKQNTQGEAFESIIAAGKNACTLHYTETGGALSDGEMVLMDFGCKKNHYCSDMTRIVPINGRFSKRQKEVYEAVLDVHKYANTILKPGILLSDYHEKVGGFMQEILLRIKLLTNEDIKKQTKESPAYKKYFMHGTSHFIGLNVHDYGLWKEPVEENMVFTIEPGIYIPEEKIGVRLENCYIINKNSENENLMEKAPIEPEEIEDFMN